MATALGALQDAQENLDAFRENTEAIRLLGDDWSTWLAQYIDAVSQAERRIDALGARAAVGVHGLTAEALRALPREETQVVRAFVDVIFLRPAQGGRGRHVLRWATRYPHPLEGRRAVRSPPPSPARRPDSTVPLAGRT
ncbi:MAG: hypothetical protein ACHQE6_07995 [Solirubrobacterales bacterium]